MDEILKRLDTIEARLGALEGRAPVPVAPRMEGAPLPPPYVSNTSALPSTKSWGEKLPRSVKGGNIESYIGQWVLGIVGFVAVIFGASFFLKYAFESNLIGPAGRVVIEVLAGLLFIVGGEWVRGKVAKFSYLLSGAGLALFYLAVYGSFHWYSFMGQGTAFGFMAAVTAFGVALAIYTNGMELAALTVVGGFLTPFLLSSGVVNNLSFFSYLMLLNVGVLSVAFFRKWRELTLLGFAGSMINFVTWYGAYYAADKLETALWVLGIFYGIYLLAGIIGNIATRTQSNLKDLFIFTINPAWFFGWYYYLLKPEYDYTLGFIAAAIGAVYIASAYMVGVLNRVDMRAILFLGGIAVVFLTIAIPLELEQNAITIAWAAEAAVLFFFGLLLKNPYLRMAGLAVFVVAVGRLFAFDSDVKDLTLFIPVLNARFFTYFVAILSAALMTYGAVRNREAEDGKEKGMRAFLGAALNLLVIVAITLEIYTFFQAKIVELEQPNFRVSEKSKMLIPRGGSAGIYPEYAPQPPSPYDDEYYGVVRSVTNQRNASISVFWTLYAVLLITIGVLYRSAFLRWSALALFGVTIAKVFFFDLSSLKTPYKIISFTVLGLILLLASFLYFRNQKRIES